MEKGKKMANPGLVQITWPMLREYIAVEVRLGLARADRDSRRYDPPSRDDLNDHIRSLEQQSTILETSFRECLPEGSVADVQSVADRLETATPTGRDGQ